MTREKLSSSLPESPKQEAKSALLAMSRNSSTRTSTRTFTRSIPKWDCKDHSSKCGNSPTTSRKMTSWRLSSRPNGPPWWKTLWENPSNWSAGSSRHQLLFTAHQAPMLLVSSALWVNLFSIPTIEHSSDSKPWSTKNGSSSNTTLPRSYLCWTKVTKPQVSFSLRILDTPKSRSTNRKIIIRTMHLISSCSSIASPNLFTWTDTCSNSHPITWPI